MVMTCVSVNADLAVFLSHLRVRLGALGLLRRRRLTLHLLLRILRRGRSIPGCTIHRAGWRMFLVAGHAGGRLAAAGGRRSGTGIVCGSTADVAWTCEGGAGAQNHDGAT